MLMTTIRTSNLWLRQLDVAPQHISHEELLSAAKRLDFYHLGYQILQKNNKQNAAPQEFRCVLNLAWPMIWPDFADRPLG